MRDIKSPRASDRLKGLLARAAVYLLAIIADRTATYQLLYIIIGADAVDSPSTSYIHSLPLISALYESNNGSSCENTSTARVGRAAAS